jgi:hypothetical protein
MNGESRVMNDEWEESISGLFEVLQHIPGGAEENHENLRSR